MEKTFKEFDKIKEDYLYWEKIAGYKIAIAMRRYTRQKIRNREEARAKKAA